MYDRLVSVPRDPKWSEDGRYILFDEVIEVSTQSIVIDTNTKEVIKIISPASIQNPCPQELDVHARALQWQSDNRNILVNISLDTNFATSTQKCYEQAKDLGNWNFNVKTKQWTKV